MTIRLGRGFAWLRRSDDVIGRHLQSVAATTVLLFLSLVAGCSLRAGTFDLAPGAPTNGNVYPWRVGVIVDKEFMPYKIQFRYWSSTPITWSLEGLPDALVKTLSPYFRSVEPVRVNRGIATERHDLIAKMSVDQLDFDGANTTGRRDRVDLTMTFTVEQRNGTEAFRTTVSASASRPYIQRCMFCKPDPREAFTEAFSIVFAKLSETLGVSDIRLVQAKRICLPKSNAALADGGPDRRPQETS